MAAVKVFGQAYVSKGPPWAKKGGGVRLGRLGFPPGTLPSHLRPYLFKKGGIPAECARETAHLAGSAERIFKMNACVSRRKGK